MSPEERQLISGLFDRINAASGAPRDAEAETMIAEGVKRAPHAAYVMAQAVIVQEEALKAASGRIEQLEARVRELESKPAPTGFLGGIGGGLFGAGRTASGVPAVPASSSAPAPSTGSPWNRGGAAQTQQSFQQQPMGMTPQVQPQQAAGSGFLGNALATAAGVAGGALLFHGLQSAFSNHSSSILGNTHQAGPVSPIPIRHLCQPRSNAPRSTNLHHNLLVSFRKHPIKRLMTVARSVVAAMIPTGPDRIRPIF